MKQAIFKQYFMKGENIADKIYFSGEKIPEDLDYAYVICKDRF